VASPLAGVLSLPAIALVVVGIFIPIFGLPIWWLYRGYVWLEKGAWPNNVSIGSVTGTVPSGTGWLGLDSLIRWFWWDGLSWQLVIIGLACIASGWLYLNFVRALEE
jgi:hypothetical protein